MNPLLRCFDGQVGQYLPVKIYQILRDQSQVNLIFREEPFLSRNLNTKLSSFLWLNNFLQFLLSFLLHFGLKEYFSSFLNIFLDEDDSLQMLKCGCSIGGWLSKWVFDKSQWDLLLDIEIRHNCRYLRKTVELVVRWQYDLLLSFSGENVFGQSW